ncbi:hypothetical protein B0O99DRAFT_165061 [Bisporella sp. PMI_857]|nr:hypothetical protein B0O99DRAFT_165061 [Bisporella sp. PMI_857]
MAMALVLKEISISCTVYEMRSTQLAPRTAGGAMMLSPNGLRVLDRLGVYQRLLPMGFQFDWVYYKNAEEVTIDRFPQGHEVYGYKAMRIYRQELLDTLYGVCAEKGIPIVFEKKFTHITSETENEVEFEFADGTKESAALLIGAEGIHSKIRNYVSPGIEPKFMGLTALTWETPTKQLRIPAGKDYVFPTGVLTSNGAFILAPQKPDGSAMLAGTQFPIADRSREDWENLLADKEFLKNRAQQNFEAWPDIVKSSIENIDESTINIWPFRALPALERWASENYRRVIILGDAAHAVPPTTGQGASQAFEDVFSLALLVAKLKQHQELRWEDVLDFWQNIRQKRMGELMDLTKRLNNKRMPLEKQALLGPNDLWVDESNTNPRQMAWLYDPPIEATVNEWVESHLS